MMMGARVGMFALALGFVASGALATSNDDPVCYGLSTAIVDLTPGTVSFPDGTNITNQFRRSGIVFSAYDADLPPELQTSHGAQENLIQEGTFHNLFRLGFTLGMPPIVSVSVTLADFNDNAQVHTLTAFDKNGKVVDKASFTESGLHPDRFTLTVSSCKGIAFVVANETPAGAETLERITFTAGVIKK